MEIMYLLIPLSAGVVLAILAVFGWAINTGQFEDLEREGERILEDEREAVDAGQHPSKDARQQSPGPFTTLE